MVNTTTVEDLKAMVQEMMKRKGGEVCELELEGTTNAGDGYMGDMIFFKVCSKKNGKSYNLVMKSATKNDVIREGTTIEMNFDRELYMYTTIFPSLRSYFSKENEKSSVLEYIPRLYWYSGEHMREALIFENLKHNGFVMWGREKSLDFEHTKLVLRNLARWHGLVMAYRNQNSSQFENWIPHLFGLRHKLYTKLKAVSVIPGNYDVALQLLEENGHKVLMEKFKNLRETFDIFLKPAMNEDDRLVITHGDCWINNIMFKYEDNKEVATDMKFLDFQFSSLNSPVEDLSFFLYTACDKTVLDKFDILMHEYYEMLSNTVKTLGSNPQEILTFDQLQEHWRKYGMFGVITSLAVLRLQYVTEEEVTDMKDLFTSDESVENFDFPMKDAEKTRILDVFVHYGNKYL